jgi:SagB-type dehydrogenase family enzyme
MTKGSDFYMKSTIGKDFIEQTKFNYSSESDQSKGLKQPTIELPYDGTIELIELPNPETCQLAKSNMRQLIDQRHTLRKYAVQSLTLSELSYLLWCTQGIKKEIKNEEGIAHRTLRTVPSAGARHPFETYLLINQVSGIAPGIYHYIATRHQLIPVNLGDHLTSQLVAAANDQVFIASSAVTFIWSVDIYRMSWRYGERSYRYIFLDAGHVCQNLYLAAESIDAGVCAIASFDDDEINRLLDLDGENQFTIYLATVGKGIK